jgi:hypothetical protein
MSRPRIRTLKPEFFADERVNAVSRDARYLTIGLITRADDRGRQQNMEQAILGHVYPAGDVAIKQLRRWLGEILEVGIAWSYEHGPFSYLWLPNFWRHQQINRPTESELPAHPADPHRSLSITEALSDYRRERITDPLSDSIPDPLTPPRAGARSVPFLSSSKESSTENGKLDAHAVADLFAYWQQQCNHAKAKLSPERRRAIGARLREGGTPEEIRTAIEGAARAAHVNDQGQRFDDIELICRNRSKLESFIARAALPVDSKRQRKARDAAVLGRLMGAT